MLFSAISGMTLLAAAPRQLPFRRPLTFEPNRGQAPANVKWLAQGHGYRMFLTGEGITLAMQEDVAGPGAAGASPGFQGPPGPLRMSARAKYSIVKMKLAGSRPWSDVGGLDPTGGKSNYLQGGDSKTGLESVPHYSRVKVTGVYDGIDVVFYDRDGDLEYDFIVAPGADPGCIQLAYEGLENVRVESKSGDLILTTRGGSELHQIHPKLYQQLGARRVEVAGTYKLLAGQRVAFGVGAYDRRRPLLIDPIVNFTKFLMGSAEDDANALVVDSAGNAYVAGTTWSSNFPTTDTSMQLDQPDIDAFVTKLSKDGAVLFSTYLGGSGLDYAYGIAVDDTGIYVTGATTSPNFPPQVGRTPAAQGYVTKLLLDGNGILYTRFFDGTGNAVTVDPLTHQAYATGSRPVGGYYEVLLLHVGTNGELIRLNSFGGLVGPDWGNTIAIDHDRDVWVAGGTCSPDFPIIAYTRPNITGCTGFVSKWNPGIDTLRWSRYWGTVGGIAITPDNSAYITGRASYPFYTVHGAFQETSPAVDVAFVSRLDKFGNVVNSTAFGSSITWGTAVALNQGGEAYIGGTTYTSNLPGAPPLTPNPTAGFVAKFSPDLSALSFTKLLGANVTGVAIYQPAAAGAVPQIFTAGSRYTGGTDSSFRDAFVVNLSDDVAVPHVLWQNTATGKLSAWVLDSQGRVTSVQTLSAQCGTAGGCSQNWKVVGSLDSNRDGVGDLLLHNATTGDVQVWLLNSSGIVTGVQGLSKKCGTSDGCSQAWTAVGVGDLNHDGNPDILWHNAATGALQAWLLNGAQVTGTMTPFGRCGTADGCWPKWQIIGIGDFNADGIDDLFWYDTSTGKVNIAMLDGAGQYITTQWLAKVCGPSDGCSQTWKPVGLADVNQDGNPDLLWENISTGELQAWLLNGGDRLLGTKSLSQRCDTASSCTPGSLPVGIVNNHHTP
jgi:hypothetical protein